MAHPAQASFFDPPTIGLSDLDGQIREVLADTLASAKSRLGLDRHGIAAEMNRRQGGRDVTKNMLDRWCAPSAEEWQLPASRIAAICQITGDYRLLHMIVEACEHKAVPSEAAAMGELVMAELEEQRAREKKRALRKVLPPGAFQWALDEVKRRGRS